MEYFKSSLSLNIYTPSEEGDSGALQIVSEVTSVLRKTMYRGIAQGYMDGSSEDEGTLYLELSRIKVP